MDVLYEKSLRLFYFIFKLFAVVELCGTSTVNRFCGLKICEERIF